jgi:hypothetical protein
MANFNDDWKYQKEIEKRDDSFLRKVYKTTEKFSSGRDKYVAYFQRGKTYYRHEAMKLFTKATGKPFMKFSINSVKEDEKFVLRDKTKTYDQVLGMLKSGCELYTLKMQAAPRCGEKKFWLIVHGESKYIFEDSWGRLKTANDLDKYYIEKYYNDEPVEKAEWETYDIWEFVNANDMWLDYKYKKYQEKMREIMRTQFLEDLVKYVCHPSRVETFEGLGFYE